jgi:hypothetical protein
MAHKNSYVKLLDIDTYINPILDNENNILCEEGQTVGYILLDVNNKHFKEKLFDISYPLDMYRGIPDTGRGRPRLVNDNIRALRKNSWFTDMHMYSTGCYRGICKLSIKYNPIKRYNRHIYDLSKEKGGIRNIKKDAVMVIVTKGIDYSWEAKAFETIDISQKDGFLPYALPYYKYEHNFNMNISQKESITDECLRKLHDTSFFKIKNEMDSGNYNDLFLYNRTAILGGSLFGMDEFGNFVRFVDINKYGALINRATPSVLRNMIPVFNRLNLDLNDLINNRMKEFDKIVSRNFKEYNGEINT